MACPLPEPLSWLPTPFHHVLGVHHVREAAANPLIWDSGFLLFGALLMVAGYALAKRDEPAEHVRIRRANTSRPRHLALHSKVLDLP